MTTLSRRWLISPTPQVATTSRSYNGHPQAERVIVIMGSAIGTCEEVVDELLTRGEKVGVLKVRLFVRSPPSIYCRRCRKACAAWRCSTAPKSLAHWPSRCTST
ncbi:hypothetical protein ACLK1Y_07655 [Escherichia coli]